MSASDRIAAFATRLVDAAGVAVVADLAALTALAGVARHLADFASPLARGARRAVDLLRAGPPLVSAAGLAGGAQYETLMALLTTTDSRRPRR